ncbi:hypothetical protein Tco_1491517 [Tanacetum coccineum]
MVRGCCTQSVLAPQTVRCVCKDCNGKSNNFKNEIKGALLVPNNDRHAYNVLFTGGSNHAKWGLSIPYDSIMVRYSDANHPNMGSIIPNRFYLHNILRSPQSDFSVHDAVDVVSCIYHNLGWRYKYAYMLYFVTEDVLKNLRAV